MAWWFLAPVVAVAAKVVFDAVTDDSSSSYSGSTSSNRNEQTHKAEQIAQQDQAKKQRAQRKKNLIKQLSQSTNTELDAIKHNYLTSAESIKFNVNNVGKLKAFSIESITEKKSALRALSHLTENELELNTVSQSSERDCLQKVYAELTSLERTVLEELKKVQ